MRGTPIVFQIVLPGTTDTPFHKRQGAVPQAMFMAPDVVVKKSLQRIDRLLCVSNRFDRVLFPLVSVLPLWARTALGTYLLKRRLKFKEEKKGKVTDVETHVVREAGHPSEMRS